MNDKKRTDYTPRRVLDKRADRSLHNRDKYYTSTGTISVMYDDNFDVFAANAAFELRHKIVYRTDGGRFARGLVRASNELQIIHAAYKDLSAARPQQGDVIRLKAHFFRRQDPMAENRWVMLIRFQAIDWIFEDDPMIVTPDPDRIAQARKSKMENALTCANMLAQNLPGDTGRRIRKMVDIAERVGPSASEDLWYYNRANALEYFRWRTDNKRRKDMTQKTNGMFPFDGHVWPNGEWRIFPFRRIAQKYGAIDPGQCDIEIKRELEFAEDEIARTFDEVNRDLAQTSLGGGTLYGPLATAFVDHLISLQKSKDHLYSAFK